MKVKLTSFSLLLLLGTLNWVSGQDTLLVFHPTAYNLNVIQHLVDEELLSLDGYHILGVYHERESYDYEESEAYINERNARHFSLQEIKGALVPDSLFGENTCTKQFKQLFKASHGAFFMGGPDIPPVIYQEEAHLLTSVTDPFRHFCELSFLFHLLGGSQDADWIPYLEHKQHYLISGICLGMQTMNVATGGTLVQDIPTELYGIWLAEEVLALPPDQMHRNYTDKLTAGCDAPTSFHFHPVQLKEDKMFVQKLKFSSPTAPLVLSSHHQALQDLGEGWVVAASSLDGLIVEAIEHERFTNVFGVQFHPEKPGLFDPTIIHPHSCNSTINFQEAIEHTDSFPFHQAYWKFMSTILKQNREI